MIKKEISEIRKQFTHTNSSITRVTGCYVGAEKEIIAELDNNFLSLPEEETFKYFEIFAKSLSGTLGKNLINMEFPLDSEFGDGTQAFLLKLRDSELKDHELVSQFYQKVIENYEYTGNYLILLVHAVYDIPGVTGDGMDLEDASDEVYQYMLCCICPVELDKAALSYDAVTGHFSARERDWIVDFPANAFLFPAFNDRSSDIHALLYYTKNAEKINQGFVDEVLGCTRPLTAGSQKESFRSLITESLGDECEFDLVRTIHEKVSEIVEENKDDPVPVILDKTEVVKVLENSGVTEEKCRAFEKNFDEAIGPKATLQATNIVDTRSMKVKTASVEIKVSPENADLLETRVIDGRRCIVITLDDSVEVNGIPVRSGKIDLSSETDI
ncbi:MAG: DUF4317 domain-containing protein [Lachnospiraceae bacterium]